MDNILFMFHYQNMSNVFIDKSLNFNFNVKILTKNMRVQNDQLFKEILDRLRWGICKDDDLDILDELRITTFSDDIIPTRLFSKNKDVDELNNLELGKLISESNPGIVYKVKYNINQLLCN